MQKKRQMKSTQADMCLKYFKKELFIYLYAFLKHLREKSQRTKNLDESYLLHHGPYFLCIFFTRIKNI